jgi:hypothetical protein
MRRLIALLMLALPPVLGCGGGYENVAEVTGQVTMDGRPLPNVKVAFQPSAGGRGSSGVTDAEGRYTLQYVTDQEGALIGSHSVYITGARGGGAGQSGPTVPIPAVYNMQTTLTAEVVAGENQIDFALDSSASPPGGSAPEVEGDKYTAPPEGGR